MMKKMFFPALFAVAALAAACGGGGAGSSAGGGSPVVPSQSKVAVKLVLHVPSKIGQMTPKLRTRLNEAQSTQGLNVVIYPNPQGTSTPAASQAFDVSANNVAACGTPNPGNARTCNFTINLAPGAYVANVGSYDATPAPAGPAGTQLGVGSCTFTVTAGGSNTIPVVLNGIAQSVNVILPVPVVRTVNALTQQAIVSVLDADNNVIVTNSYVDSSGNPVTVSLSASPSLGLVTFGSSSITAPQANGVAVTYDPTNISSTVLSSGAAVNISAALSSPVASASAALTVPSVLQTVTISGAAVGITSDGTSNIYVAEPGNQALQPYTPGSGSIDTLTPMPLATVSGYVGGSPKPNDVLYGSDGNLYFTIQNTNAVGRIPPSGLQFLEVGVQTAQSAHSLTNDGTNILWLETGNKVGYSPMASFSTATETSFPSPNGVQIFAGTGALSGIWWTENVASNLGYQPSAGGVITEKSVPTFVPASNPTGIVQWNNCMWFTENTVQKIGDVCTVLSPGSPSFAEVAIPGSSAHPSVSPNYAVVGGDGNLWFDDATNDLVVRYDGTNFSYFPLPAGASPAQMTVLKGTIWIVDTAHSAIYGLTP